MKALTLWEPWATLIAHGEKQFETRTWATPYRGTIAITAATSRKAYKLLGGRVGAYAYPDPDTIVDGSGNQLDLASGSVVALAELIDCIPIETAPRPDGRRTLVMKSDGTLEFHDPKLVLDVSQEHPYGDYSPGRFAWWLHNVRAIDPPVPCVGRQGLWTPPPEVQAQAYDAWVKSYREEHQ